MLLVKDDVV